MARVFRAEDTILGRTVAVKILRGPGRRARRDRASAIGDEPARLAQPSRPRHALRCARVGDDGSYLVMEYVEGITLRERIAAARSTRRGRLAHGRHRGGTARRALGRHRASRHQAVERAAVEVAHSRPGVAREDRRLRHRPPPGLEPRHDAGAHGRHRRLHRPGTGARRRAGAVRRHLRAGPDAHRGADRNPSVRRCRGDRHGDRATLQARRPCRTGSRRAGSSCFAG